MLRLKSYQERAQDELERYLTAASQSGGKAAFVMQTNRPYREVPNLPGLPYVCIRIPTGGGKTLVACHALGLATRRFLQAERTVCLWLVPSNTIRDQTLLALRDRTHPYQQAVESHFSGGVRVIDLAEALYVQRSSLDAETVIVVSTLQAFRVEDTVGRKVYESDGALLHHFTGLSAGLETTLERREDETVAYSLANVLRMRRPVVIMDEAHNARTKLSFDTLARFNPSCVVEFTATPETKHAPEQGYFASNVIHHVSAAELKTDHMVKLPIQLRTREDWKEVMADALEMQRTLEKAAKEEEQKTGEYLRPLVLLQAQPRSKDRQTLTADVLQKTLVEDFKVPSDQIAIATGETRGVEDVNLFNRDCPIRFIITVQALREGWDCSFAYVLCSVAETGSHRSVEQILGRILRLPGATPKKSPELNFAYAFVSSSRFIEAATSLKDALVDNGFERFEADRYVLPAGDSFPLFEERSIEVKLTEPPDLSKLGTEMRKHVQFESHSGTFGIEKLFLDKFSPRNLYGCLKNDTDRAALDAVLSGVKPTSVQADGQHLLPFKVPLLCIRVNGQLEILESSHFLDRPWNLAECDPTLSETNFQSDSSGGSAGEIDVSEAGQVEFRQFVDKLHEQLSLVASEPGWTAAALANWLDRQIPHHDIPQAQSRLFMHNVLTALIEKRGLTIDLLARRKFPLRNAIEGKIQVHRAAQARREYNQLLFDSGKGQVDVSPEICFSYDPERYSPNRYYQGGYRFNKHYFPGRIGDLDSEGEEFECAQFIDQMPEVKFWVRNLERRPEHSFWLQTSTDKFYPDFVALLNDGRILVVESKGEHLWSNDDSKEKLAVGNLWADRSNGRCLFVMPKGTDWSAIVASVRITQG